MNLQGSPWSILESHLADSHSAPIRCPSIVIQLRLFIRGVRTTRLQSM